MARRPRAHAESGFYHVILKGSGSQIIFEDDSDRRSFLSYLDTYRRAFDVRIIAWCLMSNHVHLIISDEADALSDFMHSLTSAYACKFNRRHQRTGPLFNGRFHSVAITSEGQLLNAVRYVHDNPVKGGICPARTYPWSSYHAYEQVDESVVDPRPVLDAIGGAGHFAEFSCDEAYGDYVPAVRMRLSDSEALGVAKRILGPTRLCDLKGEVPESRTRGLQSLRDAGLTMKQIQRCTGIGRGIIYRTTHG